MPGGIAVSPERSRSRSRTPKSHRVCDMITGGLIGFMIVFTPWAFGTTQPWSIWTMNITGYLLGVLLLSKWIIRWQTGFVPSQWGADPDRLQISPKPVFEKPHPVTLALACGTVLILLFVLISAINARATYLEGRRYFDYHDFIKWLPHSYDSGRTWQAFWAYLGLACFFWATRDWLLGKSGRERHGSHDRTPDPAIPDLPVESHSSSKGLPDRLRWMLWLLCLNGALLALVCILQRLDGTPKLLWLVQPRINQTPETQFGPYAYRSNAAQYFNLLWPVCISFWLVLRRAARRSSRSERRVGTGNYVVLLPCAVLMAASPIISTSRGGAFISVAMIPPAMALVYFMTRRESAAMRASMLSLFTVILIFSAYLGWRQLQQRLETVLTDKLSKRTEIYTNAVAIARDFPIYGTGPGTFGSVYQLYRDPNQEWHAYVHDDWLETRLTFGWTGLILVLLMLGCVVAHWFVVNGIPAHVVFTTSIWLALAGSLVHAKFDFPFQIYSVLFLFLLHCAVLSVISPKSRR